MSTTLVGAKNIIRCPNIISMSQASSTATWYIQRKLGDGLYVAEVTLEPASEIPLWRVEIAFIDNYETAGELFVHAQSGEVVQWCASSAFEANALSC